MFAVCHHESYAHNGTGFELTDWNMNRSIRIGKLQLGGKMRD